jgi:hypothetical protein
MRCVTAVLRHPVSRHDSAVRVADGRFAGGPGEFPPFAAHWACADHYPGPPGLGAPRGRRRAWRGAGRPGQCPGRGWQGHRSGTGSDRRRIRRPPRRCQPGSRGIRPHQGSRGCRRRSAHPGRPASSHLSVAGGFCNGPEPPKTGTSFPWRTVIQAGRAAGIPRRPA